MMSPHTMSLGEAAKATGKSKTTISRAVKSGKLSGGNRGDDGEYQIDPSELFRVYPQKDDTQQGNGSRNSDMERHATPALEQALRDIIAAKDEQIASMEAERDRVLEDKEKAFADAENWRQEYQETKQKLLTHEGV